MRKVIIALFLMIIFSGASHAGVHGEYFQINTSDFTSDQVDIVIEKIGEVLDRSIERKNIINVHEFKQSQVDRDIFLYRLLSVSGYNLYLEDALDDAKGLNLIDDNMYNELKNKSVISNEMYKRIMERYLYLDLKDKEKNVIYYLVEKGYLDSSQVLLDGGLILGKSNPSKYFKSGFFYMRLSSNDIMKDYYLGISKKNLMIDRSSYLFDLYVSKENFYDLDLFQMDRKSNEYNNITDMMKLEFDKEIFKYYPSKKRFWVYDSETDSTKGLMKIIYKEEKMEVQLKREEKSFIMMDHDQDMLEACDYYLVRSKYHDDKTLEASTLIDSKSYSKSYIGVNFRNDKNPTLPYFFNKAGTSNYYYEIESPDTIYNKKIYIYASDNKPYMGYLNLDIKDRSGRKYVARYRIKADGLVNIIFYDNKFNRIMNGYVEDMNGNKVSDLFSINSKSNEKIIIDIKEK